jgi:hypothetical protein
MDYVARFIARNLNSSRTSGGIVTRRTEKRAAQSIERSLLSFPQACSRLTPPLGELLAGHSLEERQSDQFALVRCE